MQELINFGNINTRYELGVVNNVKYNLCYDLRMEYNIPRYTEYKIYRVTTNYF